MAGAVARGGDAGPEWSQGGCMTRSDPASATSKPNRAQAAANLARLDRRAHPPSGQSRAAVAIVISPFEDGYSYLLTKRAATLRRNAGNYALPGGKADPEDVDAIATAMRETQEELGVTLERDDAIGLLDDFVTLTGHCVTPVAFWTERALTLRPDPVEVAEAWHVPLSELLRADTPRLEVQTEGEPPIKQVNVWDSWVNPPTAAWLYQFREVALNGNMIRVDDWRQPSWTAR